MVDPRRLALLSLVVLTVTLAGCTGQMSNEGTEGDTNMTKVGEIQSSSVFRFTDDRNVTCYVVKANREKVEAIDCILLPQRQHSQS